MNERLSIYLFADEPLERRAEWRKWKPLGYRILDEDGRFIMNVKAFAESLLNFSRILMPMYFCLVRRRLERIMPVRIMMLAMKQRR